MCTPPNNTNTNDLLYIISFIYKSLFGSYLYSFKWEKQSGALGDGGGHSYEPAPPQPPARQCHMFITFF